jgi:hypothetical protein
MLKWKLGFEDKLGSKIIANQERYILWNKKITEIEIDEIKGKYYITYAG